MTSLYVPPYHRQKCIGLVPYKNVTIGALFFYGQMIIIYQPMLWELLAIAQYKVPRRRIGEILAVEKKRVVKMAGRKDTKTIFGFPKDTETFWMRTPKKDTTKT